MSSLLQRSRRQQAVPSGAELRPGCVLQLCAVPGSPPRLHGALCPARPWSSVCGGAGRARQRMLGASACPHASRWSLPPRGALHHMWVRSTQPTPTAPRGALRRQARASPRGPLAAFPLGRPASDGPRGLVSRAAAPAAPVVLLSKRRDVLARPPSLCRTGRSRTPWAPSAFPPAPGWVGSPDRVGPRGPLSRRGQQPLQVASRPPADTGPWDSAALRVLTKRRGSDICRRASGARTPDAPRRGRGPAGPARRKEAGSGPLAGTPSLPGPPASGSLCAHVSADGHTPPGDSRPPGRRPALPEEKRGRPTRRGATFGRRGSESAGAARKEARAAFPEGGDVAVAATGPRGAGRLAPSPSEAHPPRGSAVFS